MIFTCVCVCVCVCVGDFRWLPRSTTWPCCTARGGSTRRLSRCAREPLRSVRRYGHVLWPHVWLFTHTHLTTSSHRTDLTSSVKLVVFGCQWLTYTIAWDMSVLLSKEWNVMNPTDMAYFISLRNLFLKMWSYTLHLVSTPLYKSLYFTILLYSISSKQNPVSKANTAP